MGERDRERVRGTHLSAGVDLADEEVNADICDASEKRLALLRVLKQPSFGLLQRLGPAALDHIREQGPRRAAKAEKRDLAAEPVPRARYGGKDVVEFLVHVNVLAQADDVCGRVEGSGEGRSGVHEDLHAHGLRDDEDVTEDNRSVDEPEIAPYWLERDLARKRRRPADLKKFVLSADSAELCRVSVRVGD